MCKLRFAFCISCGSYRWTVPCHRINLWGWTIVWMNSCSFHRKHANLMTWFYSHPVVSVGQISCWNDIRCIHVYVVSTVPEGCNINLYRCVVMANKMVSSSPTTCWCMHGRVHCACVAIKECWCVQVSGWLAAASNSN